MSCCPPPHGFPVSPWIHTPRSPESVLLLGLCCKPAAARLVEATYPPCRPVAPTAQAPHEVRPSPAPCKVLCGSGLLWWTKAHTGSAYKPPHREVKFTTCSHFGHHQVTCKLNSSGLTAEPGDILASLFFRNHVFIAVSLYLVFYLHMKKSWVFFPVKNLQPWYYSSSWVQSSLALCSLIYVNKTLITFVI